jgi:hypothetical protein
MFELFDTDAWVIELARVHTRLLVRQRLGHDEWAMALGLGDGRDYRRTILAPTLERTLLVALAQEALEQTDERALVSLSGMPAYLKWVRCRPLLNLIYDGPGALIEQSKYVTGPLGKSIEGSRLAARQSISEWAARIGVSGTTYLRLLSSEQTDPKAANSLRGYDAALKDFVAGRLLEAYQLATSAPTTTEADVKRAEAEVMSLILARRRSQAAQGCVVELDKPQLKKDQLWVDFTETTNAPDGP